MKDIKLTMELIRQLLLYGHLYIGEAQVLERRGKVGKNITAT